MIDLLFQAHWWNFKRKFGYPHRDKLNYLFNPNIKLTDKERDIFYDYVNEQWDIMLIAYKYNNTRERIKQILLKIEHKLAPKS